MVRGGHCLHQWSRTQSNIALSSGEAELNAALKGGVELIGVQNLMLELGMPSVWYLLSTPFLVAVATTTTR